MRTGPGLTAGSRRVRARTGVLVLVAVALVGGCSDDGPASSPDSTPTSSTASPALINGGGPVLDEATIDGRVEVAAEDGDDGAAATCAVVLDWTYELVRAVNGFTTTSRTLTDTERDERRAAYLDAFDVALRLTGELEAALDEIATDPSFEVASALVLAAAGRAQAELEGARAAAAELPDTAYELRRVEGGKLFVASEKARSVVFGGLDQAGTELGIAALLAPCGRPQYPDT